MSEQTVATKATKKRVSSNAIAARLEKSYGNVAQVAQEFGLNRTALYRRIDKSDRLKTVMLDARDTIVDKAAAEVVFAAANKERWAIERILDANFAAKSGWSKRTTSEIIVSEKDVDAAIANELARLSARSQTANAGEVASDGHTSEA